jgi:hypothetical protein
MEYSEREALTVALQDQVPGKQTHPKQLQQVLSNLQCKSLPWFLIGWVLWGCTFFSRNCLDFLLDYLKIFLAIGQILEACFKWYLPPFVVGRSPCDMYLLAHTGFTYFLSLWWFTSPSLSSGIGSPSPNICKLIPKQTARVKCLALKMDQYWLFLAENFPIILFIIKNWTFYQTLLLAVKFNS